MNRTQFVEFVTTVGLVPSAEVTLVEKRLGSAAADDAQALARLLVEQGKLTKFQAAAVYQGKGKSLVFGEYLVLDRIGAGGMGQVFKARHRRMDRIVALKVMSTASMKNPESVKRFEREVKAAAKLMHPNIVTALDAGAQDGVHYLVMEYVDGPDLSTLLKKQGKLSVKQACDYMAQAARGFAFAHSKGIVHRDVKPGNLLVDRDGTVKVLDMGLARFEDGGIGGPIEGELTQNGTVMGTIDYMAPEQALNTRSADVKSDVYGLGCSLYRLLTGDPLYGGETLVEKVLAHRDRPVPSVRLKRPDVPPVLDGLLARMLAKRPTDRPTMQQIADGLAMIMSGASATVSRAVAAEVPTAVSFPTAAVPALVPAVASSFGPAPAPATPAATPVGKRTHWPLAVAVGVVATVATWAVLTYSRGKSEAEVARQTAAPSTADSITSAPSTGASATSTAGADIYRTPISTAVPSATAPSVTARPASGTPSGSVTTAPSGTAPTRAVPISMATGADVPPTDGFWLIPETFVPKQPCITVPTLTYDGSTPLTIECWCYLFPIPSVVEHAKVSPGGRAKVGLFGFELTALPTLHGSWFYDEGKPKPNYLAAGTARHGLIMDPAEGPGPHHMAVVVDRLPDGSTIVRTFQNGKPTISSARLEIIRNSNEPFGSFGFIGELRVSKSVRYTGPFTPEARFAVDTDTVALYHFDEGSGDRLVDSSGNNFHGILRGARWTKLPGSSGEPIQVAASSPVVADRPRSPPLPSDGEVFQGHLYKIYVTGRVSWTEAKARCEQAGGRLASIGSAEESEFLQRLVAGMNRQFAQEKHWLGGQSTDGVWRWISGEPFNYRNGDTPVVADKPYLVMSRGDEPWGSESGDSAQVVGYVCEWDAVPPPAAVAVGTSARPSLAALATAPSRQPVASPRLSVPPENQRQAALKLIKSVFKDDYAGARSPAEKSVFSVKLVRQSRDATDAAERYALLDEAVMLAADGELPEDVIPALKAMVGQFEVGVAATHVRVWRAMTAKARPVEFLRVVLNQTNDLFDAAVQAAEFDEAKIIGEYGLTVAQRIRDAGQAKSVRERLVELQERRKFYTDAKAAAAKLATEPEDPEANLAVGRYRALVERNWANSMELLAKGSDPVWRALAHKWIVAENDGEALAAAGDAWWDAAESRPVQKAELMSGARFTYLKAEGELTGVQKTRVQSRLKDADRLAWACMLPTTPLVPRNSQHWSAEVGTPLIATTGGGDAPFMPVRSFGDAPAPTLGSVGATPRGIAERILAKGGQLRIIDEAGVEKIVQKVTEIPPAGFEILGIVCESATDVTDSDLWAFAQQKKLKRLFLANSQVSGAGLAHLAALPELQCLGICHCRVQDVALDHLAGLTKLTELDLSTTGVSDAGLAKLAGLVRLTYLNVDETSVTEVGLQVVDRMPDLETLHLDRTRISDNGVELLTKLAKLRVLSLRDTPITDRSAGKLARIKTLTELYTSGSGLTGEGVKTLQKQLPQATVNHTD